MKAKLAHILSAAENYGWICDGSVEDDEVICIATRGRETIKVLWIEDLLIHPISYVLEGIRHIQPKSISDVLRIMADRPRFLLDVKPTRGRRSSQGDRIVFGLNLPFELEAADSEIIKSLRGRTIDWYNSTCEIVESATVPPKYLVELDLGAGIKKKVWRTNRNISMSTSSLGRRIITFPTKERTGFRSIALETIIQVR